MAISIIFGTGGSGKSFFQAILAVRKLIDTQQNISTNLALNLPRLQEYIETKYPWAKVDVCSRVRILTVEETKEFWKYRGPRRWSGEYDMHDDPGASGCCFIIDEAGAAGFDAQGWATHDGRAPRGVQCAAYLDQQRKFGDDVYASTNGRFPTSIAKPFRDKAHEFIYLKNEAQTKLGPFRGASRFKRRHFASEPSKNSEPFETTIMEMDWTGIGSIYRTQDGLGVSGLLADKGRRAKGISIYWVFPIVLGVAASVVLVPMMLGRAATSFISGPPPETSNVRGPGAKGAPVSQGTEVPGVAVPAITGRKSTVENQSTVPSARSNESTPPPQKQVWVRGFVMKGNRINVILSDGRTLTEDDGTLSRIARNFVETTDGERYWVGTPQEQAN